MPWFSDAFGPFAVTHVRPAPPARIDAARALRSVPADTAPAPHPPTVATTAVVERPADEPDRAAC